MDFQTAKTYIQNLHKDWNLKEEETKGKEDIWYFQQGEAKFHIQLFSEKMGNNEVPCIEVAGTILEINQVPDKQIEIFEYALTLNSESIGVWFCLRKNLILLVANRRLEGMDEKEFRIMVDDVRFFSDFFVKKFKEKF